jgi:hypothetical protein
MAELLVLNSAKRIKSVSTSYTFPFIPSKFVSSSYGWSLKWRKLEIDNVHQFGNEAYKAWNPVSTVSTQSYGWFIYRQTLLYTPFPFLIWDIKKHEEDKVKFHIFLTLATGENEYSDSHLGCFTPVKSFTGSHCIVGWVGLRAGVDSLTQRKIFLSCRQSNTCPLITLHSILNLF